MGTFGVATQSKQAHTRLFLKRFWLFRPRLSPSPPLLSSSSTTFSSMAALAPVVDGIGIANLPNQVSVVWRARPPPTDCSSPSSDTKLSPSVVHTSQSWLSVSHLATLSSRIHRCLLRTHIGESGLGKTTLINTLFSTELSPAKNYSKRHFKQLDKLTEVEIIKAELEERQFKVKLTVIDTPGFGDYVNNRDSWLPIVEFIDDQHEAYMRQEQQPQRHEKTDLRVHACLYFIRPTGHTYVFSCKHLYFFNDIRTA